jgi:hypothetical protein
MSKTVGHRTHKRIAAVYPIRLWGLDANGKPFIEAATTQDVSRTGALLKDVPAKLSVGDVIALRSGEEKCRFRVVWVGRAGTPEEGHLGLQNLEPEKQIWDLELPEQTVDAYTRPPEVEHRLLPRLQCSISAEVGTANLSGRTRAFVTDINLGGCYVSTSEDTSLESKLTICLWLDERTRIWTDGIVISHHPGFGIGVKFLNMSRTNVEQLKEFIEFISEPEMISPVEI